MQPLPSASVQPTTAPDDPSAGTSPAASTNPRSITATEKISPEQRQYLKAIAMSSADLGAILTKPTERIAQHVGSAIAHEGSAKKERAEAQREFNENIAFYYEAKQRLLNPGYRTDVDGGKDRTPDDNEKNFGAPDWAAFNEKCVAYSLQHADRKLKAFAKAQGLLTDDGANIDDPDPEEDEPKALLRLPILICSYFADPPGVASAPLGRFHGWRTSFRPAALSDVSLKFLPGYSQHSLALRVSRNSQVQDAGHGFYAPECCGIRNPQYLCHLRYRQHLAGVFLLAHESHYTRISGEAMPSRIYVVLCNRLKMRGLWRTMCAMADALNVQIGLLRIGAKLGLLWKDENPEGRVFPINFGTRQERQNGMVGRGRGGARGRFLRESS